MILTTTTAVVTYIGGIVLSHYIQEEILVKRVWYKLFPPNSFKRELHRVISDTIDEYESSHPYNKITGQFPFYHSQILIDLLLKHVLFDKSNYSADIIKAELKNNPNIISPTNQDIDIFFTLFIQKVKNNKELKSLYIDENYKTRIYEISKKIDNVIDILKKIRINP